MFPSGSWVSARVILGFMALEAGVAGHGLVDDWEDVHRSRTFDLEIHRPSKRKPRPDGRGFFGFLVAGNQEVATSRSDYRLPLRTDEGLKPTDLEAAIFMASPVFGLRP